LREASVDLRTGDRFVTEEGGDGVYIHAIVYKSHSECVPKAMEGDMFLNLGEFEEPRDVEPTCFDIYNSCLRTDGLCMTITPPEHNVIRIVEPPKRGKERVRKLSIDEHFRLMGFTMNEDFREIQFPPTQNYTRLGRRAGNGWDVNLTGLLMRHIFEQLPELPDPEV